MFLFTRITRKHYHELYMSVEKTIPEIDSGIKKQFNCGIIKDIGQGWMRLIDGGVNIVVNDRRRGYSLNISGKSPNTIEYRADIVIKEDSPLFWSSEIRRTRLKHLINDYYETLNKDKETSIRVKYLTSSYVTLVVSGKTKID